MPGRSAASTSVSGSAASSAVGQNASSSKQRGDDGVAAHRSERRGVYFDDDVVAAARCPQGSHASITRVNIGTACSKPVHEALDDACLPAVARNDHDGADLAGAEERPPVAEACEEHRDQRQDERLAGAPAAHQPGLGQRLARRRRTPSVLAIEREFVCRHRQREQRGEKCAPRSPGVGALEMQAEDIGIANGVQNVHRASTSRA